MWGRIVMICLLCHGDLKQWSENWLSSWRLWRPHSWGRTFEILPLFPDKETKNIVGLLGSFAGLLLHPSSRSPKCHPQTRSWPASRSAGPRQACQLDAPHHRPSSKRQRARLAKKNEKLQQTLFPGTQRRKTATTLLQPHFQLHVLGICVWGLRSLFPRPNTQEKCLPGKSTYSKTKKSRNETAHWKSKPSRKCIYFCWEQSESSSFHISITSAEADKEVVGMGEGSSLGFLLEALKNSLGSLSRKPLLEIYLGELSWGALLETSLGKVSWTSVLKISPINLSWKYIYILIYIYIWKSLLSLANISWEYLLKNSLGEL